MPQGFPGNLIFAIIVRMLCGNHLNFLSCSQPMTRMKFSLKFSLAAVQYPDLCVAVILLSCFPGPGKVTIVSLCSCRLSAVSVRVDEVVELW